MGPALEDLLARAAAGERAAEGELLRELYPDVERHVHAALEREFRAHNRWMTPLFSTSDIVQDVFLGVVRGLRDDLRGRRERELRAWVAAQVEHRILDRLRFWRAARRDARRDARPNEDVASALQPVAHDPSPSRCAALDERQRLLSDALGELEPEQRALWQLRAEGGLEFGAIAERLGLGNGEAARGAFRRLRARLTVRLRRLGIDAGGEGGGA